MQERLDKVLVDQGLAESRTQAQKLIEAGVVEANLQGQWISLTKPSQKISANLQLRKGSIEELRFVSRAGLKLDLALQHLCAAGFFSGDLADVLRDQSILDIGQSTGGFTDCLLQYPVRQVVGVDVGHDQLAKKLREHPDVVCLEGINARDLPMEKVLNYASEGFFWIVMDVSFISQTLILPNLLNLLKPAGYLLSLVKPQFEVGAKNLNKKGVVKNSELYDEVRARVSESASASGFRQVAYFDSALAGGDGNREFFMLCQKPPA